MWSKKKKRNKEIAKRNSAWGKPLPPTMGNTNKEEVKGEK